MIKKHWSKYLLLPAMLFLLAHSQAQPSFQYKSLLNGVSNAGFYKIVLPPAIVSKSKNELQDIRIMDEKGSQVPYIIKSDQPEFREKNFIELPVLAIKKEADKQTHVVIQNKLNNTVNQLLLVIKNTDAERMVSISGSDDQKQWFVIKEHILLSNLFVQQQDRFVQSLDFPNSSYKYFEIIINGKDILPVNIVRVGMYEGLSHNGKYLPIPQPAIIQVDSSNKSSYISLDFNDTYLVNKLDLDIRGPKFFRRHLSIRKDEGNVELSMAENMLSSDIAPSYAIDARTKKLLIVIENEDSPPLKVQSVKAWQLNKYLLTYLEPSIKYQLVFGDSTVVAPRYDLEFFKDSIHNAATEISAGPVINTVQAKPVSKNDGGNNMPVLWTIIVAVLALLLALTFRMVKEVAGKKDS